MQSAACMSLKSCTAMCMQLACRHCSVQAAGFVRKYQYSMPGAQDAYQVQSPLVLKLELSYTLRFPGTFVVALQTP